MARKQRLPKDFWTNVPMFDRGTYAFWYADNQLKSHRCTDMNEARSFVERAVVRNVAAFASAYNEEDGENQVFVCSFKGVLRKYATSDGINLTIGAANHKMIRYPLEKAEKDSRDYEIAQWGKADYGWLYDSDSSTYSISWFDTNVKMFKEQKCNTREEACRVFQEKVDSKYPSRLTEISGEYVKHIHEVKASKQSWFIGVTQYLTQIDAGTLPVGELPYLFNNSYYKNSMEVEDGVGHLPFHVGFNRYTASITKSNGMEDSVCVHIVNDITCDTVKYVVIDNNKILEPWVAYINTHR